jgi:hypothetical protein
MITASQVQTTINLTGNGSFYLKHTKEPIPQSNTSRTLSLPIPLSSVIGRFLHNAWVMNKYFSSENKYELSVSAANGRRLIKVDVKEGEKLRFHIKYLVGWSDQIRMHTDINFAITRIANKAIFVQEASGPGVMLFEVSGNPFPATEETGKMSADRLVAWSQNARFELSGGFKWIDLYFNSPLLAIKGSGQALLDSDDNTHPTGCGILRFLRRFYLP